MPKWEKVTDSKGRRVEYLIRDAKSGTYYVKRLKDGQLLFKSTKTKNLGMAKDIRDQLVGDLASGRLPAAKKKDSLTLDEVSDQYIAHLEVLRDLPETAEQYLPPRTFDKYRSDGRAVKKHFGTMLLSEMTPPYWSNWLLEEAPLLDRGVVELRASLIRVLGYAVKKGYITGVPQLETVKKPKVKSLRHKTFTEEEIARLYQIEDLMVRLHFVLIYECGMRPFEFIRLPWSRIKTEKGVTFIDIQNRSPKKKSRIIPASSLAVKLLAEWKQVAPKSEWVFPQETNPSKYISDGKRVDSWRRELKRLNDTAGPNDPIISLDKTAYYGRHSFYTHSIMVEQHNISLMSSQGGTSESTIRRVYIEDDQHHLVPLMQQREKFLKERRGSVAVATNQKADAKKK